MDPPLKSRTIRRATIRGAISPDYGGGLLADILTHWADVAHWMLDDNRPQVAQGSGGIYAFHDGRENPDVVNALIQYKNWNLSFESSVLPIRNDRPSVFFEGTEGTLDLARDGYTFQPNKGPAVRVEASGPLENAHASNFLDALTKGTPVSATLTSGIEACRPCRWLCFPIGGSNPLAQRNWRARIREYWTF